MKKLIISLIAVFSFVNTVSAQRVGNWVSVQTKSDCISYLQRNLNNLDPIEGLYSTNTSSKIYFDQYSKNENSSGYAFIVKNNDNTYTVINFNSNGYKEDTYSSTSITKRNGYYTTNQNTVSTRIKYPFNFNISNHSFYEHAELSETEAVSFYTNVLMHRSARDLKAIDFTTNGTRVYPKKTEPYNPETRDWNLPTPATISQIATSQSSMLFTPQQLYNKYSSAVFAIYANNSLQEFLGTGFLVNNNGLAVTNYLSFKGQFNGTEVVKMKNGNILTIQNLLGFSKKNGYTLFKVNGYNFNYIPVTKRGYYVGDEATVIGSQNGRSKFSTGEVSDQGMNNNIPIEPLSGYGKNGGPVINKHGEVIGITFTHKNNNGDRRNVVRDIRVLFEK